MNKKQRTAAWLILILLVFIWGSSFILMKKALISLNFESIASLRMGFAAIVLTPFAISRFRNIPAKKFGYIFLTGIIGNAIPAFLFAKAQTGIDSSLTGILNSLTPLFTLLIGLFFFSLKTRWINISGVIIGLIGAVGLIMAGESVSFYFKVFHASLVIIATILYAININIVRNMLTDVSSADITIFALSFVGIPLLFYYFISGNFSVISLNNPEILKGYGYVAILSLLGSAFSLILFNYLVKIAGVIFSSSVTYLMPVVAILWGIADGEIFRISYLIWIILIFGGIFLVNLQEAKNK